MASTVKPNKISPASQRVIEITEQQFGPSIVQLGNQISGMFSRGDMSEALDGNFQMIEKMREYAIKRRWIHKDNTSAIPRMLEWVRLTITIT